ncbi:dihydroneopterin aldolase [Arcobacter sp. FWKO B]|uniref:dihydroneopterin aldolase n=1 Tax=Arcobacter sp. FWKO B TaxID=2593672 RepID=UPI0018A51790|nr:dihydroneopterin aldolase [Arcobacter sp. FWKO B]QOG12621.1 dihydroneopterin aldolase [Arcobacter sp. FWKO B]
MKIYIEDLTFDCIIGVLEHERVTPQKIIVNFECEYEFYDGIYLDYATIADDIVDIVTKGEFKLLEEAIIAINDSLLKEYNISDIKIKITKPDILPNVKVSVSN